jgi:dTDP-4-amino-4,6-dideoxygalactose transaminase
LIGLNNFERQWRDVRCDVIAAVEETGASGWYVLGQQVKRFEEELAQYWCVQQTVGVASGLDAIEISLRALGCGSGDKVLTTPVSAFATTLAIVRLNAIPVFVDTDARGLIDLAAAEEALRSDPSIRYFVPVHLFGYALNAEKLRDLSDRFGLAMVEDCAQSIGALWQGSPTGAAGTLAATSFYPTKNLGAMGDGGAIATNDGALAAKCRILRDYGQTAKYQHSKVGYNSRLDELQAAILRRSGLSRLTRWTERRRTIASRYQCEIQNENVTTAAAVQGSEPCWHLFPVRVRGGGKGRFMRFLRAAGVATGEHYPIAIPDQSVMRSRPYEIAAAGIEEARRFCSSEASLPIHPYLTDSEVSQVVEAVNSWRP